MKGLLLSIGLVEAERRLAHMHLQSTNLYGNSTGLEYFYIDVAFGSQKQKQALILDTGSSLAAIPCQEFCLQGSCGSHLDALYSYTKSTASQLLSCRSREYSCQCVDQERCKFYQGYAEGSYYDGYIVKDTIDFGENYHSGLDDFQYTFGCVKKETNYFYSQKADGILGMARGGGNNLFRPIYDVMHDQGIIEKRMFSLCMGKNGGYLQLGGYDSTGHLETVQWTQLKQSQNYLVTLHGLSMNNHFIEGSEVYTEGFIDSGTTFTYLPTRLFSLVKLHFQWFCGADQINCIGGIKEKGTDKICFNHQSTDLSLYFLSFPVLQFQLKNTDGVLFNFEWFASEYLYLDSLNTYCLAAEQQQSQQVMMGGTILRQHNLVFDIELNQVGIAHATCNTDAGQVLNASAIVQNGQKTGWQSQDPNSVQCNHNGQQSHTHNPIHIESANNDTVSNITVATVGNQTVTTQKNNFQEDNKTIPIVQPFGSSNTEIKSDYKFEVVLVGLLLLTGCCAFCCCFLWRALKARALSDRRKRLERVVEDVQFAEIRDTEKGNFTID